MSDLTDLIFHPAVVGAFATVIGVVGGIFTAKLNKQPDVQAVTNAAVAGIIQHYTQALTDQTKEMHSLREEVAELRATVEKQNMEIAELNNHIVDLSAALGRHGIAPPPRRQAVVPA